MPWNTHFPSWNTLKPQSAKTVVFDVGTINPIVNDSSYTGLFYAYKANGGFIMEKGVATTTIIPYEQIMRYDMTNALQVKYDVKAFNSKIGLIKDSSNIAILNTEFNPIKGSFPKDELTLSSTEFALSVNASDVISVGKYKTIYSDFQTLLNNYFGFPEGFNTLFDIKSQVNINGGVFDNNAMVNLMNYSALNASGEYVKTMTGSITIKYVNALLRFACQNNPFNNRDGKAVSDGFMQNDLIYVPTGTTVTLVANILNSDVSINYITPTTAGFQYILNQSPSPDFSNGDYSQVTTFTPSAITRVIKVPLLIKLVNSSNFTVIDPEAKIEINFSVSIGGVTNPITVNGVLEISQQDKQSIIEAMALTLGIPASMIIIISYVLTPTTLNISSNKSANNQFAIFKNTVLSKLRPITPTYIFVGEFKIVATLEEINNPPGETPPPAFINLTEFASTIVTILNDPTLQQELTTNIVTIATENSSPLNPTAFGTVEVISTDLAEIIAIPSVQAGATGPA